MIWVLVIFVPPIIMAATMLSPQGLGYTIHAVVGYSGITLLLLPITAWPLFLIQAVAPLNGQGRIRAVLSTWLGGAVLSSAVMNLLASMMDYSPHPLHLDPSGHHVIAYDPHDGFLLGSYMLSMLLGSGVWGSVARIVPPRIVVGGAVTTGLLLFAGVAGLGYVLWP